jgi:hypothetical protein
MKKYNHGGHGVPRSFDTITLSSSVKLRGEILGVKLYGFGNASGTGADYPPGSVLF